MTTINDGGGMQTYGTPVTSHSRLLDMQRTIAAFGATAAASHNWATQQGNRENPAAQVLSTLMSFANGWAVIPNHRANFMAFDFYGVGSGSFKMRFWKIRLDDTPGVGTFSRRLISAVTATLGAVGCPQPIADQASSVWVDTLVETAVYGVVPTPTVLSSPGGGITAEYLIDCTGAHYIGVEMAQDGGTATLFNGRYYLL